MVILPSTYLPVKDVQTDRDKKTLTIHSDRLSSLGKVRSAEQGPALTCVHRMCFGAQGTGSPVSSLMMRAGTAGSASRNARLRARLK